MNLVLVLHQYLPRHITGTEQYVRSLALGFSERGHNVRILAFEPMIRAEAPGQTYLERDDMVDGIPVRRISVHPELAPNSQLADYDNPLAAQLFGRFLDSHPVDVVHVFHPRLIGTGAIREPVARNIPVVVNLMDFWFICPNFLLLHRNGTLCDGPPDGGLGCIPCIDPNLASNLDKLGIADDFGEFARVGTFAGNLRDSVSRRAYALVGRKEHLFDALLEADEVIAPSRFLRGMFENQGFPTGKIRHVPYGLDERRFQTMPRRDEASEDSNLDIGYVGSLTPHKGVHVLIAAIRQISSNKLRLHIHGSPDADPDYSSSLNDLAVGDSRIAFHSAFAPDHLGNVLASLDLLVVPSLWYENTPFSVLEAFHARLPVLASDLGGITELVKDGKNGSLFPPGDSDALAKRISAFVENPRALSRLNGAAKGHNIESNLDTFETLYAPLLGHPNTA